MIELHHLNNSRSQQVLGLLEELACLPARELQRNAQTNWRPTAQGRPPLGKSP
jgi:hypothetical protein